MDVIIRIARDTINPRQEEAFDVWLQSPAWAGWQYLGAYRPGNTDWVRSTWEKIRFVLAEDKQTKGGNFAPPESSVKHRG
ncbi:MAG: hypothetical protein ACOX8W_07795 [bacterium]|jgi:hypothetical protein